VSDTEGVCDLLVGGVGQNLSVVSDQDRERAVCTPDLAQERLAFGRVRAMEGEWQSAALK
jgi:hypothetical protein